MNIADIPFGINDAIHGHAPEFEEIDFLPIHLRDAMVGIRHSNERNMLSLPIALKWLRGIGTHGKKFCPTFDKAGIRIAEAR